MKNNNVLKMSNISSLWQQLSHGVSQPQLWVALAEHYARYALPWQTGYAAKQALRLDASLAEHLSRLDSVNWQDITSSDVLLGQPALQYAQVLAERFYMFLQSQTGDWLTWLYLARLQEMLDDVTPVGQLLLPSTGEALRQAKKFEPVPGESLHWLGFWRLKAGDAHGAVDALSTLMDVRPVRCGSMMYLGDALLQVGNVATAEQAFARASLSNNPNFLLTLSTRVYAHHYREEAINVLQKARALDSNNILILLAIAKIQFEQGDLDSCRETVRQALLLQPDNQAAHQLDVELRRVASLEAESTLSLLLEESNSSEVV